MKFIDDDILHILYLKNSVLEVEDVVEVHKAFMSLPDPKPRKVLSEMGKFVSITPEARASAAEHSPDLDGIAYVIKGISQRLLLKFHIKMWKRDKPNKVFESYNEALEWLESL